jgi:undecaprenyl pyrophosphate phosphatase UppP
MELYNLFCVALVALLGGATVKHFWPFTCYRLVVAIVLVLLLASIAKFVLTKGE